ncbi:hypothetical protein TNIN_333431 [Trichonephila inaurata madagascariensis]|uniref:Uncharacterized protein n=1 Tax=Trichonephila inaurata madagascariensis TaxID=2747483 RepID=A0A8X6X2Y6_9ARAC|nr:hypothetical protein TNIN_333431 [Trichonephila inaurata madagascariensis]
MLFYCWLSEVLLCILSLTPVSFSLDEDETKSGNQNEDASDDEMESKNEKEREVEEEIEPDNQNEYFLEPSSEDEVDKESPYADEDLQNKNTRYKKIKKRFSEVPSKLISGF